MSKITLEPNDSGAGTFSIVSPDSNTNRTLNLPDESGTILSNGSEIPKSLLFSEFRNGITAAELWRLTANKNSNGVLTNLELAENVSLGAGLSVSNGVFTFPETGIWYIVNYCFASADAGDNLGINILVSSDGGSNFSLEAETLDSNSSGRLDAFSSSSILLNVTDTSLYRVRFDANSVASNSTIRGNASRNHSHFVFMRLGDSS